MSYCKKVGSYTHYLRSKLGYSIQELARRTEMDAAFIMRLEKGSYKSVKIDTIEKLAKAFDMSVQEFLYKCDIIDQEPQLPRLAQYLKEKYQFPPEAIDDIRLFISVLHQKYQDQIDEMKKDHAAYWQGKINS